MENMIVCPCLTSSPWDHLDNNMIQEDLVICATGEWYEQVISFLPTCEVYYNLLISMLPTVLEQMLHNTIEIKIPTATVQLCAFCKLHRNILSRASAVAFRVWIFWSVLFWSVDFLVDLSIFSCEWALLLLDCLPFSVISFTMLSHSIQYSKFNVQFTVLLLLKNTLVAPLTLP